MHQNEMKSCSFVWGTDFNLGRYLLLIFCFTKLTTITTSYCQWVELKFDSWTNYSDQSTEWLKRNKIIKKCVITACIKHGKTQINLLLTLMPSMYDFRVEFSSVEHKRRHFDESLCVLPNSLVLVLWNSIPASVINFFFKIPFVFCKLKKVIQGWHDMRVRK